MAKKAFEDCSGLTSLQISGSGLCIGKEAFASCSSLTELMMQEGVKSIGDYAFYSCSALTELAIPSSVTSIGKNAFQKCDSLTAIHVSPDNPAYSSLDGVLFNKEQTVLIPIPGRETGFVLYDSIRCDAY